MGAFEGDSERVVSAVNTVWGTAGVTVVALVVVVMLRVLVGDATGRDVHTLTLLGTVGGALGALLMIHVGRAYDDSRPIRPVRFWARLFGDLEPNNYTGRGAIAHLVFGGAAAPFCTWLAWRFGVPGDVFATLPSSVLPAVAYALGLAAIGSVLLVLFDDLGGAAGDVQEQIVFVGLHVVYGVTLGIAVGLYRPVLA